MANADGPTASNAAVVWEPGAGVVELLEGERDEPRLVTLRLSQVGAIEAPLARAEAQGTLDAQHERADQEPAPATRAKRGRAPHGRARGNAAGNLHDHEPPGWTGPNKNINRTPWPSST